MPIEQKFRDTTIIPDKYNTGCDDSLITSTVLYENLPTTVNGVLYKMVSGNERIGLDLLYSNAGLGDSILIENTSFPSGLAKLNNPSTVKTVTLRNCSIDALFDIDFSTNINWILEDCYVGCIYGVSVTAESCLLGNRMGDGMNPYKNVTTNNCYVRDLLRYVPSETGSIIHADGFQVPDGSSAKNENIHHTNLRVEGVQFPIENQATGCYVSSGFAITPNATHGADDISVVDSIINGGGFSIYLTQSNKTNIVLENILVGYAHRYGMFYNSNDYTGVTLTNVIHNDFLYVSSSWVDEDGHTHISVTNDTIWWKDLIIRTNHGFRIEKIKPTYRQDKNIVGYIDFEDYPIDLDFDLGVVDYFVCYDSYTSDDTQIRFVNYTETPIDFLAFKPPLTWDFINIKKKLMVAEATPLPYTPLEYLQSSGTQYLELPFKPNGLTTKIEIIAGVTQGGTQYLYGTQNTSSTVMFMDRVNATDKSVRSAYANQLTTSYINATYFDYNDVYKSVRDKNVISYYDLSDNLIYTQTLTLTDFTPTYNLIIFGNNITGTITKSYNRNYGFKIWTSDVLVYDCIPVLDGSNVPCMYDKVSETFIYNAGTGTFLYA